MSAKRLTKAQVIAEIAEAAELDKKSVVRVFDSLTELLKKELRKPNGEFVIPGDVYKRQVAGRRRRQRTHRAQAGEREGARRPLGGDMARRARTPPSHRLGPRPVSYTHLTAKCLRSR